MSQPTRQPLAALIALRAAAANLLDFSADTDPKGFTQAVVELEHAIDLADATILAATLPPRPQQQTALDL